VFREFEQMEIGKFFCKPGEDEKCMNSGLVRVSSGLLDQGLAEEKIPV